MSDTININPEYIYITVPAEYIGIYHAILTMMADYGEDMLLDCKATCKERNYNVVDCFNMFNAAIAARALHKTKLEETLIKYIKAKIQQIYKNIDKTVTFECVIDNDIYKEVYAIQGNTTIFKIDLASITNNVTKRIVSISEWNIIIAPKIIPNTVNLDGGNINLQGKVKRTIEYKWSDDRENTFETEELTLKWKVKVNNGSYNNIVGNSYNIENSTTNRDFYFIGYTDSLLGDNYTTSSIKIEQRTNSTPDIINAIYGSINFDIKPENLVQSIKNKIEEGDSNFTKINEVQQHTSTHNNTYSVTLTKGNKNACAFFLLPDIEKYNDKSIIHCAGNFGDESLTNSGGVKNADGVSVEINNNNYKLYAFITNAYYDDVQFDFGLI